MEYPNISLPVPYKAGTEGGLQGLKGEGAGQGQAHIRQESDQVDRFVSRERWSFSSPRNWSERQSRTVTRSMAARMQRGRERAQHTPEGRHLHRGRSKRK